MNLPDWFPFISSGGGDEEETAPVEPATGLSPIPTGILETVADEWPADFSRDDLEYTLNAVQDYAIKAYGPTAYPGMDEDAGSELTGHPIADLVHHPEQTSDLEELFHADDNEGVEGYIVIGERWDAIQEDLDMSGLALDAVQEAHRLYAIDLGCDEYGSLLNPLFISTDNPPALPGEVADNTKTDDPAVVSEENQSEITSDHTSESEQQIGSTEPAGESPGPAADTDTVANTYDTKADPDSQASSASQTDTAMTESKDATADNSGRGDPDLTELGSSSASPTTESELTDPTSESFTGSAATEDILSPDTEDARTAETDGSGETIDSTDESPFSFDDPSGVDGASDDTNSESTDNVRPVDELVRESSFVFETGGAATDKSSDNTDGGTNQPPSSHSSPSSTTTLAPAEASTPTGSFAADEQGDSSETEWTEWMLAAVEPQRSHREE
jgi:hypothetical protein